MAINVDMTSANGVTLATSGKYCEDNINVKPVLQEKTVDMVNEIQQITPDNGNAGLKNVTVPAYPNYRIFQGEILQTVVGSDPTKYKALLVTDPIFVQLYGNENIMVHVTFHIEETQAYTVIETWAFAKQHRLTGWGTTTSYQYCTRTGSTGATDSSHPSVSIFTEESAIVNVGTMRVSSTGELYIYPRSNNFSIRPSTYTVEVSW